MTGEASKETEAACFLAAKQISLSLRTNLLSGLSSKDASQRLEMYGNNELPLDMPVPYWKLVAEQFEDKLVRILLFAAFLSFLIALFDNRVDELSAFVEPLVILLILFANAVVAVRQESSAAKAVRELKQYETEFSTVVRDGEEKRILSTLLVPGDLITLKIGEKVPADCRMVSLHSSVFTVDQSVLTGESDSVEKVPHAASQNPDINDSETSSCFAGQEKINMLFSGTLVTSGKCYAIVTSTGTDSALGILCNDITTQDSTKSPLKKQLDQFADKLSNIIGCICVFVWIVNIRYFSDPVHGNILSAAIYYLKVAIALAVAAIPEGLPAVVTTCLALGTQKMAEQGAIVRRLSSVETLGNTSVICVDKTGTLTTNQMTARTVVYWDKQTNVTGKPQIQDYQVIELEVEGINYTPTGMISRTSPSQQQPNSKTQAISLPKESCLTYIARISSLCNESSLVFDINLRSFVKIGEPTEAALRALVEKVGVPDSTNSEADKSEAQRRLINMIRSGTDVSKINHYATESNRWWNERYEKKAVLEFSRDRKSMSVILKPNETTEKAQYLGTAGALTKVSPCLLLLKGALETVLPRCATIRLNSNISTPLTPELQKSIFKTHERLCSRGLRVVAMAHILEFNYEDIAGQLNDSSKYAGIENHLEFVGLVGLSDPLRPEVDNAIRCCRQAGIRVMVITGDSKETAETICKEVGLLDNCSSSHLPKCSVDENPAGLNSGFDLSTQYHNAELFKDFNEISSNKAIKHLPMHSSQGLSLTGPEWSRMTEQEQRHAINNLVVFSRVEPHQKLMVVRYLTEAGHIVAMTGDGVNDAPALKCADIGISMGSGTAVAREVSDMILLDDNFNTIVYAIRHGRAVFDNTKLFIRYLVSSNIGEVCCIFLASFFGFPEILVPVQLLWVNLVTDGLPATALSMNLPDTGLMQRKPKGRNVDIVDRIALIRYFVLGGYIGVATLIGVVWWFLYSNNGPQITLSQLSNFQNCVESEAQKSNYSCTVFSFGNGGGLERPCTIALSILVCVEMFNAVNALSEYNSVFTVPPWTNPWLLLAIALSLILHLSIIYVPWLAEIFLVTPISSDEWFVVLFLSSLIICLDETLKYFARKELTEPNDRYMVVRGSDNV